MKRTRPVTARPSIQEASAAEIAQAQKFDRDSDAPGAEPENLVVVEHKFADGPAQNTSSTQFIELAKLITMPDHDIRAVGYMRGYWKRGERPVPEHLGQVALRERFWSRQAQDTNLSAPVATPESASERATDGE